MSTEGTRAMTPETASAVRRQAGELSRDGDVAGPLKGHHHEAYAFPLAPESGLSPRFERGKLRVPRPGLLWFDRRCFASEDLLLTALQGRVDRIPGIAEDVSGVFIQGFVEGGTLDRRPLRARTVSRRHMDQLGYFFAQLVAIDPGGLEARAVRRICAPDDWTPEGDSTGFLDRLIQFTEERVYLGHGEPYHGLFAELGVTADAFDRLRKRAVGLRSRPFALLHCDLHRKNLIVDRRDDLWVIDWELAMIGDPLYDLATHLHLMRYHRHEEKRMAELWRQAVESARKGSSYGWEEDLPVLLAYKRAQSVYTDVIRAAHLLETGQDGESPADYHWRFYRTAWRVQRALAGARGLGPEPSLRRVAAAYRNWFRTRTEAESAPRPASAEGLPR
ncbi:phosphotransferase [Streptomyces sp. NPDC087420]|uniref:phosphotransferase n=1 Tax=Streptomyces sp. NPDC087420 TaxID=3365785 RepID=UPI00383345F7